MQLSVVADAVKPSHNDGVHEPLESTQVARNSIAIYRCDRVTERQI